MLRSAYMRGLQYSMISHEYCILGGPIIRNTWTVESTRKSAEETAFCHEKHLQVTIWFNNAGGQLIIKKSNESFYDAE